MTDETLAQIKAVIKKQEEENVRRFLGDIIEHAAGARAGNSQSIAWVNRFFTRCMEDRKAFDAMPPLLIQLAVDKFIETTRCDANQLGTSSNGIRGETFTKLESALQSFPSKYPDYASKPPKLDGDVRLWMVENFKCNEREAHVFGAIIAEHFSLR